MALSHRIEPVLHPVPINDLRPTQMTVGLREVRQKREHWRNQAAGTQGGEFLGRHMVPVVHGPGDSWWIVDHHHLARALHDEGVSEVLVTVVARLDHLPKKRFFNVMDYFNWLHCYDEEGRAQAHADLPRHVGKLVDDPFRSLAGAARAAGGYAKTQTPYAEFLWADFFRDRIRRRQVEDKWEKTLAKAVALARTPEAAYLPGYAGVEE